MTQPNVDDAGAGGTTNPPVSQPPVEGAVKLSDLVGTVRQVLSEELKPIKGDISGLYSRQDKQGNAFREFMDEYKQQKANGLPDKEAEDAAERVLADRDRQTKRDQIIDKLAEQVLGSSSTQTAGNGASGAVDKAKVVADFGLSETDADVVKLMREKNGVEFATEIGKMALNRSKQNPPSPASATAASAGQAPREDVQAKIALLAEYQLRPSLHRAEIKQLTADLEQANWGG